MNSSGSKLTYLYPITRVRSIERILRTTVHSAFPVVTPIEASSIPALPKNIKSHHVPQLYTRPSVLSESNAASPPDFRQRARRPILEEVEGSNGSLQHVAGQVDVGLEEDDDDRGFAKTYTLPHQLDSLEGEGGRDKGGRERG